MPSSFVDQSLNNAQSSERATAGITAFEWRSKHLCHHRVVADNICEIWTARTGLLTVARQRSRYRQLLQTQFSPSLLCDGMLSGRSGWIQRVVLASLTHKVGYNNYARLKFWSADYCSLKSWKGPKLGDWRIMQGELDIVGHLIGQIQLNKRGETNASSSPTLPTSNRPTCLLI